MSQDSEQPLTSAYESLLARAGLIMAAVYAFYAAHGLWSAGLDHAHREIVFLYFLAYVGAFGLIILSLVTADIASRKPWLAFGVLLYVLVAQFYVRYLALGPGHTTDGLLFGHYGALLLLEGKNPYQESMAPAYDLLHVSRMYMTPYLDGMPHERFGYPALGFLIYVPFVWAGLTDMRWVSLIFNVLTLLALYLVAPRPFRALVMVPLFMDIYFPEYLVAGVIDIIWVFGLLSVALLWRRKFLCGLCYGLACAFKPVPWFLAPFLLIRRWQTDQDQFLGARLRSIARFAFAALIAFVLPNLPFFVHDPQAWLSTMAQMTTRRAIMWGSGLSLLTQNGLLPLPVSFYNAAMLIVLALLLFCYIRHFHILEHIIWVLPGLAMWFSYRSLNSYFVYWTPLLLLSLFEMYRDGDDGESSRPHN